jgi:prolyl 4-hydroxylase
MRLFSVLGRRQRPVWTEPANDETIDWSRLAEPQTDQYDSDVILDCASSTTSANRPDCYTRTPVGDSPAAFDGQVAIRHVYRSLPEFEAGSDAYPDAPADHPNIAMAAEHIRTWPAVFVQCQRLLEAIHPVLDPRFPIGQSAIHRGSSSNSCESLFGTLWATIYCPIGMAEAIVHELAHQKLRALGVSLESATSIVGNDPADLFVSPVIKYRLRPMSAVLHAQYSFVHVTALDARLVRAESDPVRRRALARVLERNLRRIEEGRDTLAEHFHPGAHGHEFMQGFSDWTERTILSAQELIGSRRSGGTGNVEDDDAALGEQAPVTAAHPLPRINTAQNIITVPDGEVRVMLALNAPHVVLLGNVLSGDECNALIEQCESRMVRSLVVADAEGNVRESDTRTSYGVSLRRAETPLVARIEARVAALVHWPVERTEGLQVLRYRTGGHYRAHLDWMNADLPGMHRHLKRGGQRLATLLLYLSDVEVGGGTSFPAVGLEVKPQKGNAVFFLNTDSRYVGDHSARHGSMPVVDGVKFVANMWFRQDEIAVHDPGRRIDSA